MPWIFAYGSLMWPPGFAVEERVRGTLQRYHRAFNKASTERWGTADAPAPTLGLADGGRCDGVAFRVTRDDFPGVMAQLGRREGRGFTFPWCDVTLADGGAVQAVVAVNRYDHSYIGDLSVEERARMAVAAAGEAGTGAEYVLRTRDHLRDLAIQDPYVEDMARQVAALQDGTRI